MNKPGTDEKWSAGYTKPLLSLKEGVRDYVQTQLAGTMDSQLKAAQEIYYPANKAITPNSNRTGVFQFSVDRLRKF